MRVATGSKDKVGPRLSTVGRVMPGAAWLVNQERRRLKTEIGGVWGESREEVVFALRSPSAIERKGARLSSSGGEEEEEYRGM